MSQAERVFRTGRNEAELVRGGNTEDPPRAEEGGKKKKKEKEKKRKVGDVAARILFMDIVGRLLIQSRGLVRYFQAARLR